MKIFKYIIYILISAIFIHCANSSTSNKTVEPAPLPVVPSDTIAPRVSDIRFYVTTSTIRMTWQTDEAATTRLNYGAEPAISSSSDNGSALTLAHDLTISGLNASTRYVLQVQTEDASQNTTTTSLFSLATSTPTTSASSTTPDVTPPNVVSGLSVPLISPSVPLTITASSTTLDISWLANSDSDFAAYRIYRASHSGVSLSDALVAQITTQATITWQNNLSGVGYWYYKIFAVDTSGNVSSPSNEISVARYPIGNIFRLIPFAALTSDYNNHLASGASPSPAFYRAPSVFLFCDALNTSNGGVALSVKLAKNFTLGEFVWSTSAHAWNHTSFNSTSDTTFNYANIDPSMVEHLQNIRTKWGGPLTLNSSYRSPQRNANLYSGTYTYSRHQFGDAVDIKNPNGTNFTTWERIANIATAFRKQDAPYCTSSTGCSGQGANFIESYSATGSWIHADWRYEKNNAYQNY